jgi:hypothetical protein
LYPRLGDAERCPVRDQHPEVIAAAGSGKRVVVEGNPRWQVGDEGGRDTAGVVGRSRNVLPHREQAETEDDCQTSEGVAA